MDHRWHQDSGIDSSFFFLFFKGGSGGYFGHGVDPWNITHCFRSPEARTPRGHRRVQLKLWGKHQRISGRRLHAGDWRLLRSSISEREGEQPGYWSEAESRATRRGGRGEMTRERGLWWRLLSRLWLPPAPHYSHSPCVQSLSFFFTRHICPPCSYWAKYNLFKGTASPKKMKSHPGGDKRSSGILETTKPSWSFTKRKTSDLWKCLEGHTAHVQMCHFLTLANAGATYRKMFTFCETPEWLRGFRKCPTSEAEVAEISTVCALAH